MAWDTRPPGRVTIPGYPTWSVTVRSCPWRCSWKHLAVNTLAIVYYLLYAPSKAFAQGNPVQRVNESNTGANAVWMFCYSSCIVLKKHLRHSYCGQIKGFVDMHSWRRYHTALTDILYTFMNSRSECEHQRYVLPSLWQRLWVLPEKKNCLKIVKTLKESSISTTGDGANKIWRALLNFVGSKKEFKGEYVYFFKVFPSQQSTGLKMPKVFCKYHFFPTQPQAFFKLLFSLTFMAS